MDSFSEIGRLAGVSTTDWSWGALIFDMDNDGKKDIFVANGIYKDLLDQDYNNLYSDPSIVRNMIQSRQHAILTMINDIPSVKVPNYAFHNNGDYTFTNMAKDWGLAEPSFSNGSAYGDLDNDGDLDLVINNVNMPPFIYQNLTSDNTHNSYFKFNLKGDKLNTNAIGARVTVYCGKEEYYQELVPMRGFQSTVDNHLVIGIGKNEVADSIIIEWPDMRMTRLLNQKADQQLTIDEKNSQVDRMVKRPDKELVIFNDITGEHILDYTHVEDDFDEFDRNPLLFNMVSDEGAKMAVGDVNNDGKADVIIGGARGEPAVLFLQGNNGKFYRADVPAFEADKISEDEDLLLFDADNDGDPDLYIASGGNEFPSSSTALIDRLYFNDGKGHFTKSDQLLPTNSFESTSCVANADYDGDGDQDLAVGIRLKPFAYGIPANGYILQNDGKGRFKDVTGEVAPGLKNIGMITGLVWADVDGDKDQDLLVTGEYMPVSVFINTGGHFENMTQQYGLENTSGWWRSIVKTDIDNDGDIDLIVGNFGWNSRFRASTDKPITLYVNDFDRNGTVDPIICRYNGDKSYPMALLPELLAQIPSLKSKYPTYDSYKEQTINDIFSPQQVSASIKKEVTDLSTSILINNGNGSFTIKALPVDAQLAPMYAISSGDFDGDGNKDIILGGNLYRAKPETGIYDASYGVFLKGDGKGNFTPVPYLRSGFFVKGEIRDIRQIQAGKRKLVFVTVNNNSLRIFKY